MLLVGCWWSHCPCPRQCRVPSLGSDRFCQPSPSLFLVLISSWWGALTHTPCPISCPPCHWHSSRTKEGALTLMWGL